MEYNIKKEVEEAVVSSVQDWYNFILDKMPIESNRAMRIKNLTNLASILGQDLREGCNASHDQFQASLSVNYKQLCFRQANCDGRFFGDNIDFICSQIPPRSEASMDLFWVSLDINLEPCQFSLSFAGLTSASWSSSAVTS